MEYVIYIILAVNTHKCVGLHCGHYIDLTSICVGIESYANCLLERKKIGIIYII